MASKNDRMDTIVNQMLMNSDNEHAEALHKLVGIRLGKGATWSGAATAHRARAWSAAV